MASSTGPDSIDRQKPHCRRSGAVILCAETVVLGTAAANGVLAADIVTMAAVVRRASTGITIINPCGRCRQMMLDEGGKERAVATRHENCCHLHTSGPMETWKHWPARLSRVVLLFIAVPPPVLRISF
ncbi:hypothetical protein B0T17DRAFT_187207 [Bombardia bombarda]|uniref:Cytidine deaminase n=1 Tax=Bombardia bombarda TaxID=252184 RepID=A0AA39X954_9PEZI|nr:hypothetical protein B0T17DRAFT_187207 [Bombardia bombarda]